MKAEMRRKERRINDRERIERILQETEFGLLSLCANDQPYGVPLHYCYDDEKHCLYFHCAQKGKKIDLIAVNNRAHFVLAKSVGLSLFDGERTCESSADYESLMLEGKIAIVDDNERKACALEKLMKKYMPEGQFEFSEAMLKVTCVLRFEIDELSGKAK